jgi:hypothetical protein
MALPDAGQVPKHAHLQFWFGDERIHGKAMRSGRQTLGDGMTASKRKAPARKPAKAPREQSAAAPLPFSPITRFYPTVARERRWPPMGRSTGSASPALTRRAFLPACSTGRPAAFGAVLLPTTTPRSGSTRPTPVVVTTWKLPSGREFPTGVLASGEYRGTARMIVPERLAEF